MVAVMPLCALQVAALGLLSVEGPPTLPLPPAPPSALQTVGARLATGLVGDADPLPAPATYRITLTSEATPRAATFIGDALEAALRNAGAQATRATADGPAGQLTHVITLDVAITDGAVAATARLVRLPATLWESLRAPDGQTVGTATARAPVDLELRTLLGLDQRAVRLDKLRMVAVGRRSSTELLDAPLLDLLVVDLDGDGASEVVGLQAHRLIVARWGRRGLRSLAAAPLDGLPANPRRLRAPLGRLVPWYRPDGRVDVIVASSDRAGPMAFRFDGATWHQRQSPALTPAMWPLYASRVDAWVATAWPAARDLLDPMLVELHAGGGPETPLARWRPVHDLRVFGHRSASSPAWNPHILASLPGGGVAVWSAAQPEVALEIDDAGTAAAVSDLDGDGRAELVVTSAAVTGQDRVALYELTDGARATRRRWRRSVPRPVTALTAGNLDGDAFEELLAATWGGGAGELYVIAPKVGR